MLSNLNFFVENGQICFAIFNGSFWNNKNWIAVLLTWNILTSVIIGRGVDLRRNIYGLKSKKKLNRFLLYSTPKVHLSLSNKSVTFWSIREPCSIKGSVKLPVHFIPPNPRLAQCFPCSHLLNILELKGCLTPGIPLVLLFVQLLLTAMKALGSHHITSPSSNLNTQVLWVSYFQSNQLCSPNSYNHCKTSSLTVLVFLNGNIRDLFSALTQNKKLFGWLLLLMSPLLGSISITNISVQYYIHHIYQSGNFKFIICNLVCKNRAFFLAPHMNVRKCDIKLLT